MSNSALDELAVAKKWVCKLFILIFFYTCKFILRMGTPCSCAWVFHGKEGGIQVLVGLAPSSQNLIKSLLVQVSSPNVWQKVDSMNSIRREKILNTFNEFKNWQTANLKTNLKMLIQSFCVYGTRTKYSP